MRSTEQAKWRVGIVNSVGSREWARQRAGDSREWARQRAGDSREWARQRVDKIESGRDREWTRQRVGDSKECGGVESVGIRKWGKVKSMGEQRVGEIGSGGW